MAAKPEDRTDTLLTVRNVCHYYGAARRAKPVLKDVELTLRDGEIVGLLGKSGSGKSTLLRAIAGLIQPDEGQVELLVHGDSTPVAMVFQSFALFPWLTVLQNVELGLEARRMAPADRRQRALAAIDLIGLDGFENALPRELSGGMRQRVGLARAIVVDPMLLLLDEPFSALDVLTAETLRTDLIDLWSEGRMQTRAMLLVTHNIEEAVLLCDRILLFSSNPGRVHHEMRVELPQPRDRLDPAFRAMVDEIYARMTERAAAVPTEGTFPGTGIAMVLPRVSTNSLSGLIEEVEAAPFSGKAPLSDLADSLQLQVDELLPIADVLQLLRLAEIIGPDLQLTAEGQHYAGAGVDERKQMFARALQTHVPLAQHIRRVLDERASHHAPARRFRDELEDHMTPEQAAGTLRAVTHWGRFAELFSYDEQSDMFSLDDPG